MTWRHVAHLAPRFRIVDFIFVQQRFVDKVQFTVTHQPWPGEVAAADDTDNRVQSAE